MMSGYAANFAVYTMAMIGLIVFALFIYKKFTNVNANKSDFLGIEDRINLAPRKNLYVVRAGNERFLIAADVDKTSLISKLDEKPVKKVAELKEDLPDIIDFPQKPIMKEMLKKINEL